MRSVALLALVAWWRLVLVAPVLESLYSGSDSEAFSNIELLIPLLASEQGEGSPRAQVPRRPDDDTPYSGIPAEAFTLDDDIRVPAAPASASAALGSRKRDLSHSRVLAGPRPRSLYVQQADSGERAPPPHLRRRLAQLRRACERLARAAGEALLYLCRELLDLDAPAPAPHARLPCPCCGADVSPPWPWLRRDLMPLGENPYMVQRYMNMQRKKPPPPWFTEA